MNWRGCLNKLIICVAVIALLPASISFGENASLLRYYDLRQKGWTAPIRQQHPDGRPFGTCWSMSAAAAVESSLISKGLLRNTENLSVWYQVYYTYNDEGANLPAFESYQEEYFNNGGTTFQVMGIFARGTGAVLESKAPYPKHVSSVYKPNIQQRDFKVTGTYFASDDLHRLKNTETSNIANGGYARIKLLKEMILDCGAITVDLFHPDEDPDKGVPDDSKLLSPSAGYFTGEFGKTRANHSVLIVGWNDDFSRNNFGGVYSPDMKPESNGAWIVRNSWGTEYGDNGYYYVSYEEKSLCNASAFEAERAFADEGIYQYDPFGLVGFSDDGRYIPPEDPEEPDDPDTPEEPYDPDDPEEDYDENYNATPSLAYGMDTSAFANIYTAKRDESLVSIAFYTPLPDAECKASIYTGCSGSPVSGELELTFSKTLKYGGYNTLVLPSPVALAEGEKFSVVVKVTTPGKVVKRVPIEFNSMEDAVLKATFEKGRCWKSSNGTDWTDTAPDEWGCNVCLKAFTLPPAENKAGGCNTGRTFLLIIATLPLALIKKKS